MGALPQIIRLSSCNDVFTYLSKCTSLNSETVNILLEQEVDGPSFVQLTEESIRSNFPAIKFGQRKACCKIINSILASKDNFSFSELEVEDSNDKSELYDAAKVKVMNFEELSKFLQNRDLLPETVQLLLSEEVDGESFLELTDESMLLDFPGLSSDQRNSILKVLACAGEVEPNPSFQFLDHDVISIPLDDDLECAVLQGFVDENGVLMPITSETVEKVDVAPCFSGSFLKKRKRSSSKSAASRKPKTVPDDIQPLDVLSILEASKEGNAVIEFIRTKKFCDINHQKILMSKLYDNHCKDNESPGKYYPISDVKISMAKGIVTAFPELVDQVGDCDYGSWLEVVKTKFETIQSNLEPHQKKNKCTKEPKTAVRKTASKKKTAQASSASFSLASQTVESEETVKNQISVMGHMLPSSQNKPMISLALSQSYSYRRKWILDHHPSVTEIIQQYKHLKSYEGAMISEEFRRIHKLHDDAVEKFKRAAPFIVSYAKTQKPKLLELVADKFTNGNLIALVLLTKVLTVTLNKNTSSELELEHVKTFKTLIDDIPSSALFQVVPEGTDVESVVSVETHPIQAEQDKPIFPFLLWVTKDCKSGMFYLKMDKLSFLIGRVEDEDSIIKAFDIFIKAHHVFMVKYHPFLKTTLFDYFEYLYGIKTPLGSVARFVTALRNVAN